MNDHDLFIDKMGSELGSFCYDLEGDLDHLRRKWSEFRELFDNGQDRIDLLNATASNFFGRLQKLMFEDAMMHLSRLTDPPNMRDKQTLSVFALIDLTLDPTLKAAVQAKAEEVRADCDFARQWRNQRLAHTDLSRVREEQAEKLPSVTGAKVETAMKSIREAFLLVIDHYHLPHTGMIGDPWGAKSLAHYLERGKRAVDDEQEGWRKAAQAASTNT